MKQCLNDYMKQYSSRQELTEALKPALRVIHLQIFRDSVIDTIESILSLARNSIEHHEQPIKFVFGGTTKPLSFPSWNDPKSTNKIAILLTLLRTIHESLQVNEIRTIRDVYYSNVELFTNQKRVDYWLCIIVRSFQLPSKEYLNIVPAQKGLCYTTVKIKVETDGMQTMITEDTSVLIPHLKQSSKLTIVGQQSQKLAVIVLEKEAVYNKLVDNKTRRPENAIIVTGKGYPDFLTRLFLNKLQPLNGYIESWSIYTDADPYGVDIALKYMQNDCNPLYRCESLVYKGVRLSELLQQKSVQFLELSQRDVALAFGLLEKLTLTCRPENGLLTTELQRQIFFQKKAEMNAINCNRFLFASLSK